MINQNNTTKGSPKTSANRWLRLYWPHLVWLAFFLWVLLFRLETIRHGLPFVYHEDEPIYLNRAMAFGNTGNFDPDYFKKPSFFLYLYYGLYWLGFQAQQWVNPAMANWSQFYAAFQKDPTYVVTLGRTLTAVFSAITVMLLALLGRKAVALNQPNLEKKKGWLIGFLAALFLVFDPTHVKTSANLLADIPALSMILLTAWAALRIYEKGRIRDYVICGLSIALVMSFKYNFFTGAFLISAHWMRCFWEQNPHNHPKPLSFKSWVQPICDQRLWLAMGSVLGLFFLLNPYVLLNWERFLEHFLHEKDHMTQRTLEAGRSFEPMVSFDNLFFQILPKAVGWPAYVFGWGTLLYWLWQTLKTNSLFTHPQVKRLVLASFPVLFLLVLCQFRLVNAKYMLPILPFWYVLVSTGLVQGFFLLKHKLIQQEKLAKVLAILLFTILMLPNAIATNRFKMQMNQPNTRTQARMFLDEVVYNHSSETATVFAEPESIPLVDWSFPKESGVLARHNPASGKDLQTYEPLANFAVSEDVIQKNQPNYVVMLFKPIKDPDGNPMMPYPITYYQYLSQHYRVLAIQNPYQPQKEKSNPSDWQVFKSLESQEDWLAFYNNLKPKKSGALQAGPLLIILERQWQQ
jgi:hypothetical protein